MTVLEPWASAPEPTLTVNGPHAVVTGVRYVHGACCGWCQHTFYVATDGGVYITGINVTKRGPRWYEKQQPIHRPVPPADCPNCGKPLHRTVHFRPGIETAGTRRLLSVAWQTIRRDHPDLVREADQHR